MYDVVVVGGGTSGCAAAYIAGKLGLKVLLLEKSIVLGGAMTSGLVIPMMYSGDNQINTNFYETLVAEMRNIGGQITYKNNKGWFNPELLKIVLDRMLTDAGVDVRFRSYVADTITKNKCVKTIYINTNTLLPYNYTIQNDRNKLLVPIETRYVIDATGNCELGKILKCNFLNDNSIYQPMSLRFIMSGVDVDKLSEWLINLDSDRDVTSCENTDGQIYLSTAYTWDTDKNWALAPLFDKAVKENVLKDTDRNYFQLFSVAGAKDSIAFNCPRIIGEYNPTNVSDVSKALIEARQAIYRLSNFCKKYFKGFENAYISNIADSIGVRVSNRIKGKYVYSIDDLKSGKKFNNPALISNYPVDIHSNKKNSSTLENNGEYQLPIEALMSDDYDNLFVIGRCLSADYMAQGALRIQSSCFSMGEAVSKYIKQLLSN